MKRWLVIVVVLAAACGDDTPNAADARPVDGSMVDAPALPDATEFPSRWTVSIVSPPAGHAVLLPLGMDATTGDVVGYAGPGAWEPASRPVRVSGGVAAVLDVPEANYGFGWGASSTISTGEFAWQPMTWIDGARTPLPVPGGYYSGSAHAADEHGLVVGSWADYDDALPPNPIGPRPCTWTGGVVTPLPTFDAEHPIGAAWAVDASGGIAGALSSTGGYVAVRWATPASAPVLIGPIDGAVLTEARAINARGDVAGRVTIGTDGRAFFAPATGEPLVLPVLPSGNYAEAYDLDDDGRVVGTAATGASAAHAVIWIDGAIVDLNDRVDGLPPDVRHLSSAVGIDRAGRIAAEAVMTTGTADEIRHLAVLEPVR